VSPPCIGFLLSNCPLPRDFKLLRPHALRQEAGSEKGAYQVATTMPSYPFFICSAVHRPKHWSVFGEVDRPEPLSSVQCGSGFLQNEFVLAPFADKQVFFDF
jgi:hypothetical protein